MNQQTNPEQRNPFDQMILDSQIGKARDKDGNLLDNLGTTKDWKQNDGSPSEYLETFKDGGTSAQFMPYVSLMQLINKYGDVSKALQAYLSGEGYYPSQTEEGIDFLKNLIDKTFTQYNSDRDFARNSPSAQLQRLLSTGMSREAALQALQGFESSAAPLPEGLAPSQSALNQQQAQSEQLNRSLGIFDAVLQSVMTATSLADCGIDLSKLQYERSLLKSSAYDAEASLAAMRAAAQLNNAVTQTTAPDGSPLPDDSLAPWSSGYDSFRNWVRNPKNSNPYVKAFHQANPSIGDNPYFWQAVRGNYNAWHTARNQDELDKQNKVQTELIGLQRDYQQVQLKVANLDFDFQSDTYEDRVKQVAVNLGIAEQTQSNLAVEGEILGEQLGIVKTQNKRAKMEFADYSKVHNVMNDANLAEFKLKCDRLTALRNPRLIRKEVESLMQDYQFQATKAYFDDIEYQYERGYLTDVKRNPQLQQSLQLSRILHHYFDGYGIVGSFIGGITNAVGQVVTAVTPESAFGVNSMHGSGRRFGVQ